MWFTSLRRHPIAIDAMLRNCLTLTFACPTEPIRRLLPGGLEFETLRGRAFLAIALVEAEALRPAGFPKVLGHDFFLAGYRLFTIFRTAEGRMLRGLRILRSDANRTRMVVGGNLLTHYNYHRCRATVEHRPDRIDVVVHTEDGRGDLDLTAHLSSQGLPAGSPFASVKEARRFAGPLPCTFDYERETHAIVAINATRANWQPAPVAVDVRRIGFFDDEVFDGCAPILSAAFHVRNVAYRWHRGVRHPIGVRREVA